ncbi:MAG: DUF7218 family protein [Actinomycetota bacterium]
MPNKRPSVKNEEQYEGLKKKGMSKRRAAEAIPIGLDPQPYTSAIQGYLDAGYDHVYLHQIGPDQEGFLRFCQQDVLPNFR